MFLTVPLSEEVRDVLFLVAIRNSEIFAREVPDRRALVVMNQYVDDNQMGGGVQDGKVLGWGRTVPRCRGCSYNNQQEDSAD